MTAQQAADRLRVTRATIHNLAKSGRIKYLKEGKRGKGNAALFCAESVEAILTDYVPFERSE